MSESNGRDSNFQELSGNEGRRKVADLIKGIRIAMMTTLAPDGSIDARPMAVPSAIDTSFDGTLYFLTRQSSDKVDEIHHDHHVTLAFANPSDSKYIALKGRATVSYDRGKIHELWNPMYKAWFPKGEDDPEIAVVRVEVTEGDFWEASDSKLIVSAKYLAAAVTGGSVPVGTAGHIIP